MSMHGARGRGIVYTRETGDYAASVDERLVERLLSTRAALRRSKEFERADGVLEELVALGVTVDDDARQWSVTRRGDRREKAKRHRREREQRESKRAAAPQKVRLDAPYTRSASCTAALTQTQHAEISDIVARRLEAKNTKRYADADALLASLAPLSTCVCDEKHEWRADGQGFAAPYAQQPGTAPLGPAVTAQVEGLLQDRTIAKSRRDYATADGLLAELLTLGVVVEDRLRVWRPLVRSGLASEGQHDYRRLGSAFELDERLEPEADRLLTQRLALKVAHDFDAADVLQASLTALGIEVDDRKGTWDVAFAYTASSWRVRE